MNYQKKKNQILKLFNTLANNNLSELSDNDKKHIMEIIKTCKNICYIEEMIRSELEDPYVKTQ